MPRTAIRYTWRAPDPWATVIVVRPASSPRTGSVQAHIGDVRDAGSRTGSGFRTAASRTPAGEYPAVTSRLSPPRSDRARGTRKVPSAWTSALPRTDPSPSTTETGTRPAGRVTVSPRPTPPRES